MDESQVFANVLKRATPAERAAYLDHACAGDPGLRADVEALLRAHAGDPGFLEQPAGSLGGTTEGPPGAGSPDGPMQQPGSTEQPGVVLAGRYKLLEPIGEGGMGTVWMTQQTEPVKRLVAVKLIKLGLGSKQVLVRFEAERQALALMDHPNIAKVLDAGTAPDGRPFFVMELVKGVPITRFCDEHRLTPRQRLELFVPVCQAVQHAHQKGIIHRDLKPSNVLVALYDDRPVPKVIDFGVAKATGQQLTGQTLHTGFGAVIGTAEYMSPEQASFNQLDVDTRSDVYALGVLLYELLTGTTPFAQKELEKAGLLEMLRLIREREPPRPSTKLSTAERLPTLAANRGTEPKRLTTLVRGELDWIVMKALEKDRSRRYATANGLAMDVQRYLANEPVQACPPSARYRLRKFVRRNKGPVLAAALVLLTLVAGLLGTAWAMVRALQAEATAVGEAAQKEAALQEARKSERARTEQLCEALVAEARATRLSRRQGQRFKSLEILRHAAQLARELDLPAAKRHELRNVAIACLALPDLRPIQSRELWPAGAYWVSFDGRLERYARADRQGQISVRRVADDVEMARLTASALSELHVSPDGRFVAAWDPGLRLRCWKVAGPTVKPVLDETGVTTYDFSPDSRQFALIRAAGHLDVFDPETGKCLQRIENSAAPNGAYQAHLAFHPREAKVAVAGPSGVRVVDLQAGQVQLKLPDERAAYHVRWHPNGGTLAVVNFASYDIHFWDVASKQNTLSLSGHKNAGIVLAFSPRGEVLLSRDHAGMVRWWDPYSGQQLLATPGAFYGPGFAADGRLAGGFGGGEVGIWESALPLGYRTLVRNPVHGKGVYWVPSINPDGRLLAVGMKDGVGLWDLEAGTAVAFLPLGYTPHVLFEPSGSLLTNTSQGLLRWRVRPGQGGNWLIGPPEQLAKLNPAGAIALSWDGRVLAHAAFDGGLVWHRDQPGKPIHLRPHEDVRHVAVSPNGRWVATGSFGGLAVKVWEAQTGKLVRTLLPDQGWCSVCFSPDDKWLATPGGRLWSTDTWEEKPGSKIGNGMPAFTVDGKLMAVAVQHGVLALVEVESGRELARLEDPNQDAADYMVFSPDGSRLVTVNVYDSGTIHVWDLRTIGEQLKELGLDGKWPAFAGGAGPVHAPRPTVQLVVDVVDDAVLLKRIVQFQAAKDVAGCRATAALWETVARTDGNGRYHAACLRAITAAVIRAPDASASAARDADAEADRAMAWLRQAVAAGFNDVAHMKTDTDLDALRNRDDFRNLLRDLEAKTSKR